MTTAPLQAPFPYFGGKRKAAETVWPAFGRVDNYVEPFAGSAAMLLAAPEGKRIETINDFDGMLANFWRSIAHDPDAVAHHADWPVNECVPAGTLISTPDGDIPVEQIRPGMVVLGESDGKVVETIVLATKKSEAVELYGVGRLRLTGNHPVWTKERGYLDAANLLNGMTIRVIDWPINKLSLVMLKCNDGKQSLGNLFASRSTDEPDSLCGRDVSQKAALQRAHVASDEGREDTQGLLDTVVGCCGASAHLSGDGNGSRCRLAGCGNTVDCFAKDCFGSLQPHGWRGRDAGAISVREVQDGGFAGSQGHPIPTWTNWSDDGEEAHAGSSGEDTHGGVREGYASQREVENIRIPQRGSAISRAQTETCEGKDRDAAIGGAQEKDIGGCNSSSDSLCGDGGNIPVNHCGGNVAWRERSLCVPSCAQGMPLQRESLQAPVAVYNFQTETGNYFAEKILVHNCDLFARHSWLVRHAPQLTERLHADPGYYDARMAGWWVWGVCAWIGDGWCDGKGPWVHDGTRLVKAPQGPSRPPGAHRRLPHLSVGRGINKQSSTQTRSEFIGEWFLRLHYRLRDVRVTCGDWQRVVKDSVTTHNGLTGVFLDPPYTKGAMDYSAGGMGLGIADDVRAWCADNGRSAQLRIVLCGHAGEHDALLAHGWHTRTWKAGRGYAKSAEANANRLSETIWCSPHCVPERGAVQGLFFA